MMKSSYLILDEYICFLDKGDGEETKSQRILDVGVEKAMKQVKFDQSAFVKSGGLYDWSRENHEAGCGSTKLKKLEF